MLARNNYCKATYARPLRMPALEIVLVVVLVLVIDPFCSELRVQYPGAIDHFMNRGTAGRIFSAMTVTGSGSWRRPPRLVKTLGIQEYTTKCCKAFSDPVQLPDAYFRSSRHGEEGPG